MARTVSPVLANIVTEVTEAKGAMSSATLAITGFAARQQAAIDAALELGATAEELAPIQAEVDALSATTDALAAAIASNP